jgi:hypothetical protein
MKKKYKPVAQKVRPIVGKLPDKFCIHCNIIRDPLANIPTLDPNLPPFKPTGRYMQECKEKLDKIHDSDFLWDSKCDLLHDFMCKQNEGFTWDDTEHGCFHTDFFPPVDFPVLEHIPWVEKNIPIPPGLFEVCRIVCTKLDAGVYEPSNSSYRSCWFCILKKDRKSL